MVSGVQMDIWDNEENVLGIISYPKSVGEWFILSHQIKKISRGCFVVNLGKIIGREPTKIEDIINVGAKDKCFAKTIGLMNDLLPYSLQLKQNIEKDVLIKYAFNIFRKAYEIHNIIGYLNKQKQIILSNDVIIPNTISGMVVEVPSIPDLTGKVHSFSVNARHILIETLNFIKYIYQIDNCKYSTLSDKLPTNSYLLQQINPVLNEILFLWELRNVFEHPKENYYCKINNFSYKQGKINNPGWQYVNGSYFEEETDLIFRLNKFYDFLLGFIEDVFNTIILEIKL